MCGNTLHLQPTCLCPRDILLRYSLIFFTCVYNIEVPHIIITFTVTILRSSGKFLHIIFMVRNIWCPCMINCGMKENKVDNCLFRTKIYVYQRRARPKEDRNTMKSRRRASPTKFNLVMCPFTLVQPLQWRSVCCVWSRRDNKFQWSKRIIISQLSLRYPPPLPPLPMMVDMIMHSRRIDTDDFSPRHRQVVHTNSALMWLYRRYIYYYCEYNHTRSRSLSTTPYVYFPISTTCCSRCRY